MNNTFNINRFGKLVKQQYQLSGKSLGLALASIFTGYTIILLLFTFNNEYIRAIEWIPFFIMLTISIALPFAAYAFPAFRSKEKTFDYLLLPCSAAEKFTFNVIVRIIAPWLILPVIFYVCAHLATELGQWYNPTAHIEAFSLSSLLSEIDDTDKRNFLVTSVILFGLINQSVLFAGATVFKKQPLIKTLVSIGVAGAVVAFYLYTIIEWAGIYEGGKMPWFALQDNDGSAPYFLIGLETALLITTWAYAFFKVKEKEIA